MRAFRNGSALDLQLSPASGAVIALAGGASRRVNIQLNSADVTLTQTSDTAWTLAKTGGAGVTTVTWSPPDARSRFMRQLS